MNATITKNEQYNSVEVSFDEKPSEAVRDALKALRFRWHGVKKVWYGRATVEEVRAAIGQDEPQAEATTANSTPQDHIRIYWNGIKIDGGKLLRCHYSIGNLDDGLTIYASDYSDLPRDLLPVENDSDSYTDYFEKDRAHVTPEHPLYKYFAYAAMKARARDAKRFLPGYEQTLATPERYEGQHAYEKAQAEACRKQIADFEAAIDPGQPTAEDIAAIDAKKQAEENARKEAEHEEELRRREAVLNMRVDGLRLIDAAMKQYPVKDDQPRVLINWSEHPALGTFGENALYMSVAAAEFILGTFDKEQHDTRETDRGIGWYWKTKFTIVGEYDGEPLNYVGRYDLGDGDGGLIAHIREWGEWCRTHETNGIEKANPDETNDIIEFANALGKCVAAEAVGA